MADESESVVVHLGTSGSHLRFEVIGREHPDRDDYWDGNWLRTRTRVRAGPFRGDIDSSLRTDEFRHFLQGLRALAGGPDAGSAVFDSIERWLEVRVVRDHLGHVSIEGWCTDPAALSPNRLRSSLGELDQTFLPPMIAQLEAVLERFPVVGDPAGY